MVRQQESVPRDWKNGIIIPLPSKGDLSELARYNIVIGSRQSVCQSTASKMLLTRLSDNNKPASGQERRA